MSLKQEEFMVQSLKRAMELLEILREFDKSCSLSELAEKTALPPSTVHRILQTFVKNNYVSHDPTTHLYRLGPALIPLGKAASSNLNLRNLAVPILKKLMRSTKEDSLLMIANGFQGIAVEKVEGPNHLKVIERSGSEWGLHYGAIRKCLLAFQPDQVVDAYIQNGLKKVTENSIVDADKLWDAVEKIRREKVAVSIGEYIPDAVGVGAPVFDQNGNIIAAIGIIAPKSRASKEEVERFKTEVKKYSEELSVLLGNADHRELRY